MKGIEITDEQLRQAAYHRFRDLWSYERTAKAVRCGESTLRLYNANKDERWLAAIKDVVAEMRQDAAPTAWASLLRQAERGDTAAAKEILNRVEGAVAQRVALGQDETKGPVQVTVVPVHSPNDPLNHVAQEQDQCAEDEEQ